MEADDGVYDYLAPASASREAAPSRTPRVFAFAAWVAIVAGIVFIVAVIFFTGFTLGRHAGHHGGFHHKHHAMMMHPHRFGGPGGFGGPAGGPAAVEGGGPASAPKAVWLNKTMRAGRPGSAISRRVRSALA